MNKQIDFFIKFQEIFLLLILSSLSFIFSPTAYALERSEFMNLSKKQTLLVPISAAAASGDLATLKIGIIEGLEQGLSINEIKDLLTQVYAYAGFPRSLNALVVLQKIITDRDENQKTLIGSERKTNLLDFDAYSEGKTAQTKLIGQEVNMPFTPDIDYYLKAHLFGDIFSSDLLSWQDREVATISMLASMDGVDSQLLAHINIGKYNGISQKGLEEISDLLTKYVSFESGERLKQHLN